MNGQNAHFNLSLPVGDSSNQVSYSILHPGITSSVKSKKQHIHHQAFDPNHQHHSNPTLRPVQSRSMKKGRPFHQGLFTPSSPLLSATPIRQASEHLWPKGGLRRLFNSLCNMHFKAKQTVRTVKQLLLFICGLVSVVIIYFMLCVCVSPNLRKGYFIMRQTKVFFPIFES